MREPAEQRHCVFIFFKCANDEILIITAILNGIILLERIATVSH